MTHCRAGISAVSASHWVKAYGTADVDSGRPVQTNTPFQAASISKPVTAMAAMRLVDERRFSLDDDINTILKSWHAPGRSLTPRSLMSHTSGADDGETRGKPGDARLVSNSTAQPY